jgi:hypothetical protein
MNGDVKFISLLLHAKNTFYAYEQKRVKTVTGLIGPTPICQKGGLSTDAVDSYKPSNICPDLLKYQILNCRSVYIFFPNRRYSH